MFVGLQKTALLKTQKPSIKNKKVDLGVKSKYVSSQQQTLLNASLFTLKFDSFSQLYILKQ